MQRDKAPFDQVVILGGAGAMGTLLARQLKQAGARVLGCDLRSPNHSTDFDDFVTADVLHPPRERLDEWSRCDVAIVALPHEPALAAIAALAPMLPADALLVDTLSVKTPVHDLLISRPPRCEYLSINPMFAPSLGFAGQSVLAVAERAGPKSEAFTKLMESWGSTVVLRSAEEHDRLCAVMQTATHLLLLCLGKVMSQSGVEPADLLAVAPPPHRLCLSLLSRILSGAPETYWDIQRDNPQAGAIRQQLADAIVHFGKQFDSNDAAAFAATLAEMRQAIAPYLPNLTKSAADAIRAITPASRIPS